MLAAELGNHAIVALLAENQANLRILDAEGRGEPSKALPLALYNVKCADDGLGIETAAWKI